MIGKKKRHPCDLCIYGPRKEKTMTERRKKYVQIEIETQHEYIEKEKSAILSDLYGIKRDLETVIARIEGGRLDPDTFCGNTINALVCIMKTAARARERKEFISTTEMLIKE